MSNRTLIGDCRDTLKQLPDQSVHCVITSPPYWGLRSYKGETNMIGMEKTFDDHLTNLLSVFDEVWRVLRDDGTLWLNYGDKHFNSRGHQYLRPKDLMMMPAQIAIAMQKRGWYLRSEIVWWKPNPMPDSVKDRPTSSHEKIFLLTKRPRYYYDHVAVRTAPKTDRWPGVGQQHAAARDRDEKQEDMKVAAGANLRNVWYFSTAGLKDAHFAVFPTDLAETCIKAGTSEYGVCAASGAPYERDSERGHLFEERTNYVHQVDEHTDRNDIGRTMKAHEFVTTGWNPTCGAPYKREFKTSESPHDGDTKTKFESGSNAHRIALAKQAARERGSEYKHTIETVGWQPTCDCKGETEPAVVLDPFGGSGTVGVVAKYLGRDSILCEISEEYAILAEGRILATPKHNYDLFTELQRRQDDD